MTWRVSNLEAYFDRYVDYGFTPGMEQQLDDVAGEQPAVRLWPPASDLIAYVTC